jgi:23S rRNA (cytidine1920-2'-O)/16S rRNA (cytidine1409-2'-O)-methyltransferase
MAKERLDILVHERGFAASREKARAMIMAAEVLVNGTVIDKPGARIAENAVITVKSKPRFVSRGGDKLDWALNVFGCIVTEKVCVDVGASTGGFTDCLLQRGAARVYALDVGYGQLDYSLRQNPRVIAIERTNARYVEALPEAVSLAVIDASFISLRLLLPVVRRWLTPEADVIPLIKPQFEAGREDVGRGGVIKNRHIHARVLDDVLSFAVTSGFVVSGLTRSPILGPAGNTEFLAWLRHGSTNHPTADTAGLITAVLS